MSRVQPTGGNTPPPNLNIGAVSKYLGAFDAPRAANRRLLTALVAACIGILVLAIGIMSMLPLKQRVPYFVTVNDTTGAVTASNQIATRFTPTQTSERYFLSQWVTNLLTIGPNSQSQGLPDSYSMLRGTALSEWSHFIFDNWKPLARLKQDPTLHVYPQVDAIGFLGNGSAVIRVSIHDSTGQFGKHLMVTVKFSILPPSTDAQIYHNPIGLWITHFEVANETPAQ